MTLDCGVSGSRCRHSGHAGYLHTLSLEKMLLQPQADVRNHPRKDIQTDVDVAGKSPTSIAAVVPCEEEVEGGSAQW